MESAKMLSSLDEYECRLKKLAIKPKQMPNEKSMAELKDEERLMHARFLCLEIRKWRKEPGGSKQANRLFGYLQAIMSYELRYTLGALRASNRPD